MKSSLFYTVVIGFASGIFLRSFFDWGIEGVFAVVLTSLALGFAWRIRGRDNRSFLFLGSVFLIVAAVGMFRFEVSDSGVSPLQSRIGETGIFEGVVVREPDMRESSQHLYIEEETTGALMLVTTDPYIDVAYGDRVTAQGTLEVPESFESETGRIFDYPGYLKAKRVGEVISFAEVEVEERGQGSPVMAALLALKARFMHALELAIPEPAAGLGEGMLLGVKRALGDSLTETFRIAGIIHIVVLSGYNIMVVADSIMRVLGHFFYPRTRLILGIVSIVLFALMVGLSATVVRASLMAVLVLIARNTGKTYAVMRALCLTGVLMLLHNPYLLAFDPGFQLSFLATLGLVLLSPQFELRFTRIPEFIRGNLATTLGTQLFVLPILLFSMGTLSLVSVLVNVLVLPMVPYAMLVTFVAGIAGLFSSTLGVLVGFMAHLVLSYIIKVAELFASLPLASVEIPAFSFVVVLLLYVVIGLITWWLTQRAGQGSEKGEIENDYDGWVIEEKNEPSSRTIVITHGEYSGWTIEEVKESDTKVPGERSASGTSDPLPFR